MKLAVRTVITCRMFAQYNSPNEIILQNSAVKVPYRNDQTQLGNLGLCHVEAENQKIIRRYIDIRINSIQCIQCS